MEKSVLEEALRRSTGNKSEAARRLGISPSAIGRKLARFEID